jgi:predicted ester cyclase
MTEAALAQRYRDYIARLNERDWENLRQFVSSDARHNAAHSASPAITPCLNAIRGDPGPPVHPRAFGPRAAPCCEPAPVRLPARGLFLGLAVNGRSVVFAENVFYRFHGEKIDDVRSVIDWAAIEARL